MIDPIKPLYKAACKKDGEVTLRVVQNSRNTSWIGIKFSQYTNGQSPALFTWIFVKDRELGYILEDEKEDSCDGASITSSLDFNFSGNKSKNTHFDTIMKSVNDTNVKCKWQ